VNRRDILKAFSILPFVGPLKLGEPEQKAVSTDIVPVEVSYEAINKADIVGYVEGVPAKDITLHFNRDSAFPSAALFALQSYEVEVELFEPSELLESKAFATTSAGSTVTWKAFPRSGGTYTGEGRVVEYNLDVPHNAPERCTLLIQGIGSYTTYAE